MDRIGILFHPQRVDSSRLADQVSEFLTEQHVAIWRGSADDEQRLNEAAPDLDLLITLGGDGTIVHAARTVAFHGLPILGVNLGTLGFLAEVDPPEVFTALRKVLEGGYLLEERMMLHTELRREDDLLLESEVINDVFMGRGVVSRMVYVSVEVDSHHVMTQTADGIIVSTPTGTTAYCLAAGGPIVAPDLDCMTITPVAAHLSIAHAIVIPPHRSLCLRLIKGEGAMLTIDGQIDMALKPGDRVCYEASRYKARFIRFGDDANFYETVLRRLRWPDRQTTSNRVMMR